MESGVTFMLPLVFCAPLQAPLAMQEVALVDDQVRVEDWPRVIAPGLTSMLTPAADVPPPCPVTWWWQALSGAARSTQASRRRTLLNQGRLIRFPQGLARLPGAVQLPWP